MSAEIASPGLPRAQAARVTPLAAGNQADVRRDRFLRFRPIKLVRHPPDLRAELCQLLLDRLVTAIDVVD
ncbi:MAG: hypothetical protein ACRETP_01585, partial [Steroidobacteraceae bacterium]